MPSVTRRSARLRASAVAGLLLAALGLAGCDLPVGASQAQDGASPTAVPIDPGATGAPTPAPSAEAGTALAVLASLPVKGRAPMTGYSREQFGQGWSDAAGDFAWSRNGCDTRNDLLARDLQDVVVEDNGCVVDSGVLAFEPYGGATDRVFDRLDGDYATDLDGEHVVALGNAWATGAQRLDAARRAAFANDPINLLLVDPSLNRQKADADAATWLPPDRSFRCSYVARQIRVKARYGLWVTPAERRAMTRVLAACPDEPVVQPAPVPAPSATAHSGSSRGSRGTPGPRGPRGMRGGPRSAEAAYADCTAVRAAGADPIRRGDPGYATHLDRDGDGVGCE